MSGNENGNECGVGAADGERGDGLFLIKFGLCMAGPVAWSSCVQVPPVPHPGVHECVPGYDQVPVCMLCCIHRLFHPPYLPVSLVGTAHGLRLIPHLSLVVSLHHINFFPPSHFSPGHLSPTLTAYLILSSCEPCWFKNLSAPDPFLFVPGATCSRSING